MSVKHANRRDRGFSLAEMLVVLAIIGVVVAIGIPLINEQVRIADIRGSADLIAVHLRAARMIAVTQRRDVTVTVNVDPTNSISYVRATGDTVSVSMPRRVLIKTGSAASITFHSDGSVAASGTITTESTVSNALERWTLNVNTLGFVSVAHARV
jgi:prepilin-type N-terminal cleavage/methylation domain-containing protein